MSRPKVKVQHLDDGMHEYLLQGRHAALHFASAFCAWCGHHWHVTGCTDPKCHCDTARQPTDDTWRPKLEAIGPDFIRRICHDTGVDGYAAKCCLPTTAVYWTPAGSISPTRLKNALYGIYPASSAKSDDW